MAAGQNPLAGMIMSALQSRTQGGMPPSPGGGPGSMGMGAPDAGQAYGQQVAELKGADPGGLLRQLKAMKQILAIMLVQNLDRLPNVSGQISKVIPQFDRIIKEIQQASNVNAAVRNPIQMGAAQPGPEGQSNQPSFGM